jgi:hypothetical protein
VSPLRHLAAALLGAAVALAAVAVHRQGVGGLLLALVLTGRPEGDYAVASDLAGYALMAAGVAVLAVGVASLRRLRA